MKIQRNKTPIKLIEESSVKYSEYNLCSKYIYRCITTQIVYFFQNKSQCCLSYIFSHLMYYKNVPCT